MTLDEMRKNAYMSQKDDGKGFKKFSDAIPEDGFNNKPVNTDNGFQKQTVPTEIPKDKDSVYRRVAKFLVMIGEDEAAKILPHLSEDQIMKIVPEIASVRSVSKEEQSVILEEFNELLEQSKETGGVATAREMLEKAYGKKRAEEMIQKSTQNIISKPFEFLQNADKERIYQLLKDENEGVQTIVLSHLEPKKAAAVINCMTPDEKKLVVLRMAKMEPIAPDVIKRIDKSLHEKSLRTTAEKSENIDGRNALAQILKRMNPGTEKEILSALSDSDEALCDDIRDRLFTIDDVIKADDKVIQEKLREMADAEIVYLIAQKTAEFRQKIFSNVSMNRKAQILSDEELLKPFRKFDVDKATEDFVNYLRRQYDQGTLLILGRNDEQYVEYIGKPIQRGELRVDFFEGKEESRDDETEGQMKFYYNREERLKKAPRIVQDYYNGDFKVQKGMRAVFIKNKSNRFLLITLFTLTAFAVALGFVDKSQRKGKIGDYKIELTSFSFEDEVYTTLKAAYNSKKNNGNKEPVGLNVEFRAVNIDNQTVDKKTEERLLENDEEIFRTRITDFDIYEMHVFVSDGKNDTELYTKVKK